MSPLKDGAIILILVIFFFGAKKLPELSRSLGQSVREFRGGINEDSAAKQELPPAPVATTTQQGTSTAANADATEADRTVQSGS